jgi:hypothetical protein
MALKWLGVREERVFRAERGGGSCARVLEEGGQEFAEDLAGETAELACGWGRLELGDQESGQAFELIRERAATWAGIMEPSRGMRASVRA